MAPMRESTPPTPADGLTARWALEKEGGGVVEAARVSSHTSTEIYLCSRPGPSTTGFENQARQAYEQLFREVQSQGIQPGDILTEKVFLTDLELQVPALRKIRPDFYGSPKEAKTLVPATTFVQQPPARPGILCEIQVFATLPGDGSALITREMRDLPPHVSGRVVQMGNLRHVYLANVVGGRSGDTITFDRQATAMFQRADECLHSEGLSFKDVVRTWIYVSDIDRDYGELNRARTEFFRSNGLKTFPASTGIQGTPYPEDRACGLDLRAVAGEGHLEIRPIQAPTLNEAYSYGSDFSRGLRVTTDDRCVIYISGTASIDTEGNVVELGNVEGQVNRMLLNVEQLLAGQGAGPDNLLSAITYLKHPEAREEFLRVYRQRGFPEDIPHTLCVAGVCRPEWLCEMEAIAVLT